MAMDANSTSWNDDRLDGFAGNVDKRFDKVDERFDKVDVRFERLEDRMEAGFDRVNDRLDFLSKALVAGIVTLTGGMLAGFAAILALIATQI